jgi:serine/threonine protein kinase
MSDEGRARFTRMNQVITSFHDYVLYMALERDTGLQVFWYEFINDNMSQDSIAKKYERLIRAKQISSPNILKILDVSMTTIPARFYVITEGMLAGSLADHIRTVETPSSRSILKWFRLLCNGVQALHKADIVHGSLSLRSVCYKASSGSLKISLPLTTLSGRLVAHASLDIDEFRAPEQIMGIAAKSNDIWALGIALIEMITRTTAYSEMKTPSDLIEALVNYRMPEALSLIDARDQSIKDFILRCLARHEERPTIDDILGDEIFQGSTQGLAGLSPSKIGLFDTPKSAESAPSHVTQVTDGQPMEQLIELGETAQSASVGSFAGVGPGGDIKILLGDQGPG